MSLIGKLRDAEQQGKEAALQGLSRARTSLEEAQSQLRRKMRIHPRTAKAKVPVFVSVQKKDESAEPLQPIITVNGQDLPAEKTDNTKEHVA